MSNGGVIGKENRPSANVASGVWSLDDLYHAKLGSHWPGSVEVHVGSFTKINTVATQAVTFGGGKTWTPKAIIFFNSGSNDSSGTWDSYIGQCLGFAAGSTNSYAVAGSSYDGQATAIADRRMAAKALTMVDNGTNPWEADLQSFDSGGFTLNWTTNSGSSFTSMVIGYMAIGGEVQAKAVNWTTPAATGNQSVTGAGFQPDLVFHIFNDAGGALPATGALMRSSLGVMNSSGEQWAAAVAANDATAADTSRWQKTDATLIGTTTGEGQRFIASYVSMNADGFTTNFSITSAAGQQVASLCLKGVRSKVGAFSKSTSLWPVQIDTTATVDLWSTSSGRCIDVTQNGTLWAVFRNGSAGDHELWYKPVGGSWTAATTPISNTVEMSIFIDLDDYMHVAYKLSSDGHIYYRRGTPNAGRTDYTAWSAALLLSGGSNERRGVDIVAHRHDSGSWKAHVVWSETNTAPNTVGYIQKVNITSGGTITLDGGNINYQASTNIQSHLWASLDFNHTGDGKTVAGGAPHIFIGWQTGNVGAAGRGVRSVKVTYSGGVWTMGTPVDLDTTHYVIGLNFWLNCRFDGTRVLIGGQVYTGSQTNVRLYEVDPTTGNLSATRSLATGTSSGSYASAGAMGYDSNGNVYIFGDREGGQGLSYRKFTRSTLTYDSVFTRIANVLTTGQAFPMVKVRTAYEAFGGTDTVDYVMAVNSAGPYSVRYGYVGSYAAQSVTGVGFGPKLLLTASVVTAQTVALATASFGMGAAAFDSQVGAALFDRDNIATTEADSYWSSTSAFLLPTVTTNFDALGALSTIDTDGFTVNWAMNDTNAHTIMYVGIA